VKYPKNEFNSTTHICEIETKANVLLALYIIDSIILFIWCNKQEKQQGGESYALPFFLIINRHVCWFRFFGFLSSAVLCGWSCVMENWLESVSLFFLVCAAAAKRNERKPGGLVYIFNYNSRSARCIYNIAQQQPFGICDQKTHISFVYIIPRLGFLLYAV
jgi:hypothetical protein